MKNISLQFNYNCSIDKLWSALTVHNKMQQWYFKELQDFKAEIGFKTEFLIVNEGRKFTHLFEVLEVIPKKKLTHTWNFKEHKGKSTITFMLSNKNNSSSLSIFLEIIEDFPDLPEFKTESGINGWNYFLDQQLRTYIENN